MTFKEFLRHSDSLGMRRRHLALLLGLNLVSVFFESLGVAMLLPIAQLMISGGDPAALVATSRVWSILNTAYSLVGLNMNLASLMLTSFVLMLGRQAFVYGRARWTARIQNNLVRDVRNEALRLYYNANTGYLDKTTPGRVVNDLTTELGRAVGCIMSSVAIANYTVHSIIFVAILFVLSVPMTLSVLAVAGAGLYLVRGIFHRSELAGHRITEANQAMSGYLVERLKTVRLVKLSGTEQAELNGLHKLTQRQRDSVVGFARLVAVADSATEPVALGLGFGLLFLGYTVFNMGLPEIGLFLVILLRLMPIVKTNILTWQSFVGNLSSLQSIIRMFDQMIAEAETPGGSVEFAGLQQGISLRAVTFQYRPEADVPTLNGVSVDFPVRSMTGLVGPSGSGKSTLIDILPRLREANSGEVRFDGRLISEFSRQSLRRGIAYVSQSPQIFDVSAAQHIRYGKPGASDQDVERAAHLAGAHTFLAALPQGYDTLLGEAGLILSGGQRQRLDLARALVREAPILILDEPTSHLDADAEHAFRQALWRIRRETDTTIIVIGHRLSTIRDADQIVVLQDGNVTEQGTHADLLTRGGWYAQAYRKQHQETAAEGVRAEAI